MQYDGQTLDGQHWNGERGAKSSFVTNLQFANHRSIVNRGDWLWGSANIKGANKDAKIYVGRSRTVHSLLFCPHTLCMNDVTNTFLLVSFSAQNKRLLCFVHRQGQKREQKHTTKKFVEFHNHSPLLTMIEVVEPFSVAQSVTTFLQLVVASIFHY